jgi:acetylornithine deacetylase/succinyl-diaminopimelate desuccinylase family protein
LVTQFTSVVGIGERKVLLMLKKMLLDEIDKAKIPELLLDLVSISSYDNEQRIVKYIARRFERIGIEYQVTEVCPARQNLTASIGKGGRTLIFNTHMDTVPPGDMANWRDPPLKLTRNGENLFGLGSCDAKGSLASMLTAFEVLARDVSSLNGRLILQAVCCEESRARGTLAEVRRGVTADAAIVGEPTDLIPMIGHKGGMGLEIAVTGKAAHGSSPEEGINAISKMARVIQALDTLAEDIAARSDPLFGSASLAVTQVHGGQAPNVIPDSCTITVDRRLIPGEVLGNALDEISEVIDRESAIDGSLSVSIEQKIGISPCRVSHEEPIVRTVKDSIAQVGGRAQEVSGFPACCDMWCLVEGANIPTVILGPGELCMAHKANESISVDHLYEAARIYAAVALNWLR